MAEELKQMSAHGIAERDVSEVHLLAQRMLEIKQRHQSQPLVLYAPCRNTEEVS